MTIKTYTKFIELELAPSSIVHSIGSSPARRNTGKKKITITDDGFIECPFKEGELYLMYLGNMRDEHGNLLFPFHPLITPWYEWCIKEKLLQDAVFNTENPNLYMTLYKESQAERGKAWLDAYDATMHKGYGAYVDMQRKKELKWYNQYFKNFE
jgi:hypothetical protein